MLGSYPKVENGPEIRAFASILKVFQVHVMGHSRSSTSPGRSYVPPQRPTLITATYCSQSTPPPIHLLLTSTCQPVNA